MDGVRSCILPFCPHLLSPKQIEPQANEYNRDEKFNRELFAKLGTAHPEGLGLLGLTVVDDENLCNDDVTYGGANWTDKVGVAVCLVHEEMCYSDPAFCLSYLAHSLLLVNNLSVNASHEQKLKYLPELCAGTKIGGMGMSEPGAGTDVLGMQTKAEFDEKANTWRLSGTKMWITNGTLDDGETGDVFLVYARTGPGKMDITQFIVEKGMAGFKLGQKIEDKLGMRSSMTAELVFDNVEIPAENVVGEVNGATLCMMRNLAIERLGLAAMALGIARRCVDEMKNYAEDRNAFGSNLYGFGQIQKMIAESYGQFMAGRSYTYAIANTFDLNQMGTGLDADGTKLFSAPMAKDVADRAIQIMGGNGYVGEYKVERLWRDAKLLEIGGGTNESHHKNMCRDLRKMGNTE